MALKPVAADGEVSATPGTTPYTGAASGTWTAGPIVASSWSKLKIGGIATIWKAKCTFSFTGSAANGTPVSGTSEVTLTASATKLQGASDNVLRDGDNASDSYGNRLSISAAGKLKSG